MDEGRRGLIRCVDAGAPGMGGGFGECLRSSATLSRTHIAVKEVAPLGDCYQCDSWSFAAEAVVQSNLEKS